MSDFVGLYKPIAISGLRDRPDGCAPFNAQAEIAALRGLVADLTARVTVLEQAQPLPRATSLPPRDQARRLPEFQAEQVMSMLVTEAADGFDVTSEEIRSDSRLPGHVEARDWVEYEGFLRGLSTPQIGRAVNRDHTSVMAGINREAKRRALAKAAAP